MHLNKLAIRVVASLLIQRGLRRPGTDYGICGLAEDGAASAGGNNNGVGGEGSDFHRSQIHRANTATDAVSIEHGGEKFPVLVLFHFTFRFVASDLLVECVEKLLACGCTGKCCPVIERSAKA